MALLIYRTENCGSPTLNDVRICMRHEIPPYLFVLFTIHLLRTIAVHEPPAVNASRPKYDYEQRSRQQR